MSTHAKPKTVASAKARLAREQARKFGIPLAVAQRGIELRAAAAPPNQALQEAARELVAKMNTEPAFARLGTIQRVVVIGLRLHRAGYDRTAAFIAARDALGAKPTPAPTAKSVQMTARAADGAGR